MVEYSTATFDNLRIKLNKGEVSEGLWDTISTYIMEKYFKQPNYWKIDGKPYFSIYQIVNFIYGLGSIEKAREAIRLLDDKTKKGRENLVESARTRALRMADLKYIEPHKDPVLFKSVNIKSGLSMDPQLYNLPDDPGEHHNLAGKFPDKVKKIRAVLDKIQKDGHSRPGFGK